MGLKADVEEVLVAWRKATWPLRLWLFLSLLVASGSVASLSETVFRWKGFLLDGLLFYRTYIAAPLQEALGYLLPVSLPPTFADVVTLASILTLGMMRTSAQVARRRRRRGQRPWQVLIEPAIVIGMLAVIALLPSRLDPGIFGEFLFLSLIFSMAFHYWLRGGVIRMVGLGSLLAPFLLIGLLGAVNAGLSR
jgi:hypothetical protein